MNIMAKFKVIIKEELTRSVLVEAEDIAEAIEKTEEAYNNEEVVLDYNDYDGASFNAEEIEEYEYNELADIEGLNIIGEES